MSWHLVKSTPRSRASSAARVQAAPISEKEVEKIMAQMQEGVEKPKPKVLFEVGEMVRVKDGPFTDFNGNVEEVNYEKSRVRVSVTILVVPRRSSSSSVRSRSSDHTMGAPACHVGGSDACPRAGAVRGASVSGDMPGAR
jgi:hypothetical protein